MALTKWDRAKNWSFGQLAGAAGVLTSEKNTRHAGSVGNDA
jgi:hypothetical protein